MKISEACTTPDGSLDYRRLLCELLELDPDRESDGHIAEALKNLVERLSSPASDNITHDKLAAMSVLLDVLLEPRISALSAQIDRLIVRQYPEQAEINRRLGISPEVFAKYEV